MTQPALVLASASPRRRELLRRAGIAFAVQSASSAEIHDERLGLAGLVTANARAKAMSVAAGHPLSIVLGADTLISLDGRLLGKPAGLDDARRMLRAMSGKTHEVATGVHLVRMEPRRHVEFHEITRVRFRALDETTIGDYLARVDVTDKAGAYALQESGEILVEAVEGSQSNVVGLPLARTLAALRQFDA